MNRCGGPKPRWAETPASRDRLAAAPDRQALQYLSDEHEQRDDQRCEELADRRRRDDGDRHRQLHRHAALEDVLESFLYDRPTADKEARDADHANGGEWLPSTKPDERCGKRDKSDANGFLPLERMLVVVPVFVVVVVVVMPVAVMVMATMRVRSVVQRRWRGGARFGLVGQGCAIAAR
ncbi:hypothetical protein GCM10020258_59430 [Sphingomonas yabuuchiae]